jgi:hypothetical protein
MIDWNLIIQELQNKKGSEITTDPEKWNLDTPGYNEIYNMWKNANFNAAAIKWINYYPGIDFPQEAIDQTAKNLGLNQVHRAWISRIDPGYMAPWHWDVDDNEQEYLKSGPIVRYTVIIKEFANGHILIIDKNYFYNLYQGKEIRWKNHRDWHSGINAGMEPNWLLHILGY